jgi:hypothetical protein
VALVTGASGVQRASDFFSTWGSTSTRSPRRVRITERILVALVGFVKQVSTGAPLFQERVQAFVFGRHTSFLSNKLRQLVKHKDFRYSSRMLPTPRPSANRAPVTVQGPARVLILPDVHIPYHDEGALRLAVERGRKWAPTHVLLNGDWIDFYGASSFVTDPKQRDLAGELRDANKGFEWLRKQFRKAEILFKLGNHEERWDRYLYTRAPELVGTLVSSLEAQLPAAPAPIGSKTSVLLGKLLVLHGHEYRFAIQNPVSPARGLQLRVKTTALCSHFHQRSEHSTRDGHGKLLTTWSTGCLCQLSPDYLPRNEWSHGFAMVEVDKNGAFDVQNLRIIDGKVYQ